MSYMKKSEVYSWRVASEVKAALEHEAHREGSSIGGLLQRIALDWLAARRRASDSEGEQARLHREAANVFGALAGGDPDRSRSVRAAVRRRLAARRAH